MAYIPVLSAGCAVLLLGWYSYLTVIIAFVVIPTMEFVLSGRSTNYSPEMEKSLKTERFFNWLLYFNIPMLYIVIGCYIYILQLGGLERYELIGLCLSVGIAVGANGINVAHELGHKNNKVEQFMAKILLLPALYMHFFIEHNKGHHLNVGTPQDPASSRKNEIIYFFWIRSTIGGYLNAWKLESLRLKRVHRSFFHWSNEMIQFTAIQAIYLLTVYVFFGFSIMTSIMLIALVGFLLLESINYIEHYGLRRKKLASGRYERVEKQHSWNSNHEVGRIFLYELTRHADHHYKSTRPYQILRHHDDSPQLPLGYPGSVLLSLVPPLWFWVMNARLMKVNSLIQ